MNKEGRGGNDWIQDLLCVLSGINDSRSRLTVSAPMANDLAINQGKNLAFLHYFSYSLLNQLESVLVPSSIHVLV